MGKKVLAIAIIILSLMMMSACGADLSAKPVARDYEATITSLEAKLQAPEATATPDIEAMVQVAVVSALAKLPCQQPCVPCGIAATPIPVTIKETGKGGSAIVAKPVAVSGGCFFDLRKSLRGVSGAKISNDRSDWNGQGNGLVSFVRVYQGMATVHFELWGPPGKWTNLEKTYEACWQEGSYNLQSVLYPDNQRDLNDTLQWVSLFPGAKVSLFEHDLPPEGITLVLTCPSDP